MNKSYWMFLFLLLAGPLWAVDVLDQFVPNQDADYQTIRSLQERFPKGVSKGLPEAGSTRAEMLLALAEIATNAAGNQGNYFNDYKPNDYDALYALLQKYRDELKALGLKQSELENQLAALKVKQDELEKKIESQSKFSLDGVKIYGTFTTIYDDLAESGPASPISSNNSSGANPNPGTPKTGQGIFYRDRFALIKSDLRFEGTRGPMSAYADLIYQYYFGIPWPYLNFFGARELFGELRLPVAFQFGDLHAQMTPLTLWRNEDEEPYEAEPFSSRRQRLRDYLLLEGNTVNLRGMRVATDFVLFDKQIVHFQGFFDPLASTSATYYFMGSYPFPGYSNPLTPLPSPVQVQGQANGLLNGLYNTYLGAWQADVPVSIFDFGYAGTIIKDTTDSNIVFYSNAYSPNPSDPTLNSQQVRGYDSQVHSGQASVSLFNGMLKASGELAESLYSNPNRPDFYSSPTIGGFGGYLTGTAMLFEAEGKLDWVKVKANFRSASDTFVSSPAQGRTQDTTTSNYGPFLHEQSQWDPQTNLFFNDYYSTPDPGEDQFTKTFLMPQMQSPKPYTSTLFTGANAGKTTQYFFNYLLPYNAAINASTPYGYATPNRTGYGAKVEFNFLKGALKPSASIDLAQQQVGDPGGSTRAAEAYTTYAFGGTIDMNPLIRWPLRFKGGWRSQDINNGDWIKFDSTVLDGGAEYDVIKSVTLFAGLRHIDYNGTLAYPLYGGYGDPVSGKILNFNSSTKSLVVLTGPFVYNQTYDIWAVGLRYQMTENSALELNYGSQLFWDVLSEQANIPNHYELDQGYLQFDIRF